MDIKKLSQLNLKRVFAEAFSVRDIAENLLAFDLDTPVALVRRQLASWPYPVVGVREEGRVRGYIRREELVGEGGLACRHPFVAGEILPDSAPFAKVFSRLRQAEVLFVAVFGGVGGIVGRHDLQKPPVRMWLFGMVTIAEMHLTRLIQEFYPGGDWRESLSAGRLAKAEELLAERLRRNQLATLLDCLQFSDKGRIAANAPAFRRQLRFESRNSALKTFQELENLRNGLAHSQELVINNWEVMAGLAATLDAMFQPQGEADPPGREGG